MLHGLEVSEWDINNSGAGGFAPAIESQRRTATCEATGDGDYRQPQPVEGPRIVQREGFLGQKSASLLFLLVCS